MKNMFIKLGLVEEAVVAKKAPTKPQTVAQPKIMVVEPTIDASINQMLLQSIEENKLAGFDYLKFMSSVEEMKVYGTQEDARFKMTFATAKQLGVDKEGLNKSAQHYLDVLKNDENEFNTECTQFAKKEITARETKLTELEAKLTTLSGQIEATKVEYAKLSEEVSEKKDSLELRRNNFKNTFDNLVLTIQANLEKINKYL